MIQTSMTVLESKTYPSDGRFLIATLDTDQTITYFYTTDWFIPSTVVHMLQEINAGM